MNCDEAEASRVTSPPRTDPDPRTTKGRVPLPSSATSTPSARSASSAGPGAGVRVAVEVHLTVGEGGERGHEAHHRAGEAAVDPAVAGGGPGGDEPVVAVDVLDTHPERAESLRHEEGVTRPQGIPEARRAARASSEDEETVGQRLAAGERDGGVDGSRGGRAGPVR